MSRGKSIEMQMDEILESIKDAVDEDLEKSAEEAAKETKKELRVTSPKDKGGYSKGWAIKKDRSNKSVTVYNKKYPGLTHLLENGHAIVTSSGSEIGRVNGIKHIEPAAEKGADEFVKEIMDEMDKDL